MKPFCFHKFVDGFGGMGDALTCVKCGYSKYPEALGLFARLCPVVENDNTYGSREGFPFVVKFPEKIGWKTDWTTWTHFFDRDGKLKPKSELTFRLEKLV